MPHRHAARAFAASAAALSVLLALPVPARAELPEAVIRMMGEAYRSGNDQTIKTVTEVARRVYPDDAVELDRLASGDRAVLDARRTADRHAEEARIKAAGFLDIWKGEVEVGGSRATGNTDTLALYASASLTRDALQWRQKLVGRIDFQRTNDATTTERALLSYQPNYKYALDSYVFGLAQYEHDRFLGYTDRYTLGAGLGHDLIDRPAVKLSVEGGPALRRTGYLRDGTRNTIAARASLSARWALSPDVTVRQDMAGFVESHDRNASATTALDTRLIGTLRARLSYNILYEHDVPDQRKTLDTISRASLVYGF